MYTHDSDDKCAPILKLNDLAQLYMSRMEQVGVKLDVRVHTAHLKKCLLAQFTDMQAQKQGRDILLAYEEDIGTALAKAYDSDGDNEAIYLACAAKIICSQMFGKAKPFNGFPSACQKNSGPSLLLALVNMVMASL